MAKCRKYSTKYLLVEQYGSAKEESWQDFHDKLSLPTLFMHQLNIPYTCRGEVVETMRDILRDTESTVVYDPSKRIKDGRGAKSKLDDLTPQAEVVYNATESGMSLGSTAVLLNQWRRASKVGVDRVWNASKVCC
jgi:hypothetical protein